MTVWPGESAGQPRSRNAPCYCGSGKRFKECHGALATAFPSAPQREDALVAAQTAFAASRFTQAPSLLTAALAEEPERVEGLVARARIELAQGDTVAAVASCRAALALAPHEVAGWNLLGEALRTDHATDAEAAWRRALELDANDAEAHFHLGNLYRKRGTPREAIIEYESARRSAPRHAGIQNNLGLALEAIGERERAEECYRDILVTDPAHVEALGNLANVLFERERYADTVATYERLFSIRRDVAPSVWLRRAIAQQGVGDLAAAEASLREAARRAPDEPRIQSNLGTVLDAQGRLNEADAAWRRALELQPGNLYALSMLAHGRQKCCAWGGLDEMFTEINRVLESDAPATGGNINPFPLLAMPMSPQALLTAAQRWARSIAPSPAVPRPNVTLAQGERLRVGFVCTDFGDHPTAHLCMEWWERLDRRRIEAFAYAIRTPDRGPIGARIAGAFEHFVDVSAESTAEIVRRIRTDRIAIVLDLNGYTRHSREAIFALRPAPLQINAIGFQGTLGADWYDYIQVDRFVAPESLQRFFSERFFYMPNMSYPSDTTRAPTRARPSRAACGLPDTGFVFCNFNNAYKILPDVFAVWMRLLAAVRGSVLWLLQTNAEQKRNLMREAAHAGIDPNRLVFAPTVPMAQHLVRYAAADLFVDTYPYGAHTTANDALLVGLPLLARVGDTLPSRIAAGHLNAIGLPELIASDLESYEAVALRVAHNPDELATMRARLARNRHTHALFDMATYTRDFEDGLVRLWSDHTAPISSA